MSQLEKETDELSLEEFALDSSKVKKVAKLTASKEELQSGEMPKNLQRMEQVASQVNESGEVGYTRIEKEVLSSLDNQVESITEALMNTKPHTDEFKELTETLKAMGNKEITRTSKLSEQMLNRQSVRSMKNSEFGGKEVAQGLSTLRQTVVSLDPTRRGKIFKSKILGIPVPFLGQKVDSYFQEYKTAESQINDIIVALTNGKDRLMHDNAYIEEDRAQTHEMMNRLEQYAYVMKKLDEKLTQRLPEIEAQDKLKAQDVKQAILFPLRQKRIDIMQHLAVSMQGYMALGVLWENNEQLINGVDRATTTTIAALRNAVTVAEALGSQKLVLDQINALNDTTNQMIAATTKQLVEQGMQIQKQATESAVDVKVLQDAFKDIFQAMDQMDKFREAALPKMLETINNLENAVNDAKAHMTNNRAERAQATISEVMDEPQEEKGSAVQIRKKKM